MQFKLRPEQVFDGHNDAVTRDSTSADWAFLEGSSRGHLDVTRARQGDFVGGFFAIFPGIESGTWSPRGKDYHVYDGGFSVDLPPALPEEFAHGVSERMFDRLHKAAESQDFVLARTFAELDDGLASGAIVAIAHFEGAEALGSDLRHFDHFYERGLRSVGPVWSRANAFGTGVPFRYPAGPDIGPGLTEAGFELVRECDRRGVVLDLAHLNEAGFWDVSKTTTRPLVVTHTAAHALSAKPRNLTDKQIDAVGNSGGVVGVTFFTGDLTPSLDPDGDTSTQRIAEHIRYIADRIGPEHVAIGSDFDGALIPRDMRDAAGLGLLIAALRRTGFDDAALSSIAHGNWLRVLESTLTPI